MDKEKGEGGEEEVEDKGTEMKKGEGDKKEKNEEEEEDTVEAGEGGQFYITYSSTS